jgi:hypothetical protein
MIKIPNEFKNNIKTNISKKIKIFMTVTAVILSIIGAIAFLDYSMSPENRPIDDFATHGKNIDGNPAGVKGLTEWKWMEVESKDSSNFYQVINNGIASDKIVVFEGVFHSHSMTEKGQFWLLMIAFSFPFIVLLIHVDLTLDLLRKYDNLPNVIPSQKMVYILQVVVFSIGFSGYEMYLRDHWSHMSDERALLWDTYPVSELIISWYPTIAALAVAILATLFLDVLKESEVPSENGK